MSRTLNYSIYLAGLILVILSDTGDPSAFISAMTIGSAGMLFGIYFTYSEGK